jgi:hypothetical protein
MHLGPMIVNRVTQQLFESGEIDALRSMDGASPALTRMTRAAVARFERASAEAEYISTLRAARPWVVEVPQVVLARHDSKALIDGMVESLRAIDGARGG